MAKIDKFIVVAASSVRELNSMTGVSRQAIQAILLRRYTRVEIMIIDTLADLEALVLAEPDLVFLGMKFVPSDNGKVWLSEYLDEKSITYTGSSHQAMRLELDKQFAKHRITDAGLNTPRFQVFIQNAVFGSLDMHLTYPVFIKPTNRGGGAGVDAGSLAYNFVQLHAKVASLSSELQADAIIEEYLPGREFSVGILKNAYSGHYFAMPLELIAPVTGDGARFLSRQIKKADTETHQAVTDVILREKLNNLALESFYALGARDYGRIDIRLDASGTPHFLEANLLPSLLAGFGNFPKACLLNAQLSHQEAILQIVDLALARKPEPVFQDTITEPTTMPIPVFGNIVPASL